MEQTCAGAGSATGSSGCPRGDSDADSIPETVADRTGRLAVTGPRRTAAERSDKLLHVLTFASVATSYTVALLITFLGIGVVANVLIGYAVAQVVGERSQNAELRNASFD